MSSFIFRYFTKRKVSHETFNVNHDYFDNFNNAFLFTKNLGFKEKWNGVLKYKEYDYQYIFNKVCSLSGISDFSPSAGQCLKWSHYLQPYFQDVLKCRVWLTIGQLWKEDTLVYSPSVDDFQRWIKKGIQPMDFKSYSGFNFHAWLTVENGIIIDISFMSTLAQVLPRYFGEACGRVIYGKPEYILPEHKYVPMIVGCDIAEKIEELSFIEFLAHNYIDLYTVPFAFIPDKQS
ncbi:hypothetical protein O7C57_15960 [Providencia sp. 21OH12SH02B-Prov]|uniref:hypothetical protein n=1 Tax=Providencia sp. 21OH12SH02B-Prov TaxID=3015951 RepID=UPI0022B6C5E3|nr:hypothetical protein [Providencia sp. 21OH12SH02B-Prov]WBA56300.1 hypothetical protein O7C57_15960 [Providencia sp. 21OH12SH02B-Prov]